MTSQFSRFLYPLFFVTVLLAPTLVWAQTMTVTTDRQTVELGDVVSLAIETDFQTSNSLDLSAIETQFDILGTQRSNNLEYINGSFSSRTRWRVQILAKQVGELIIPSLQIENAKSQPLTLTVVPIQKTDKDDLGPYFLESSLSKSEVRVQEEVIYTLRLYFLGSVSGSIRPPDFGQTLSEPLKDQSVYGKSMNGKNYTVYEWVYALYPQKSGVLEIPGALFSGLIHYEGRQKGVSEIADQQTLTVLPEVTEFKQQSNNAWLPASDVLLSEQWLSSLDEIRVGDSLTRTLTLRAVGLKPSQLPSLTTLNSTDFKVYADPAASEQVVVRNGIQSQTQVKQAIIPTQAGELTLPEQRITWWNTTTKQIEVASIPARTLTVLPAIPGQVPLQTQGEVLSPDALQNRQDGAHSIDQQIESMVSRETKSIWQIISLLLLLAWVGTLLLWRRSHLKNQKHSLEFLPTPHNNRASSHQTDATVLTVTDSTRTGFSQADTDQAWSKLKTNLCDTDKQGNIQLPPRPFYNKLRATLSEQHGITQFEALQDPALQKAIHQLEAHLFNQAELEADCLSNLCHLLQQWSSKANAPKTSKKQLRSLYGEDGV